MILTVVAVISKVLGSGLGARMGGFTNGESLRLGIGMISRGEVGLIVAQLLVAQQIVSEEIITVAVIMVLVTTLVTPPMLRAAFTRDGLRRRAIRSLREDVMPTMVILVLDNVEKLDDVLTAWWDAGAPGITILESVGAARHLSPHTAPATTCPSFPA